MKGPEFAKLIQSADAFVCAAGFEKRCQNAPLAANVTKNPIIVTFRNGPLQNDKTLEKYVSKFQKVPGYQLCELDWSHVERFEVMFEQSLRKLTNLETNRIIMDVSGLPNFAICVAIIKIRQVFPIANLTLLHTEAEEYFPQHKDFDRIKQIIAKPSTGSFPEYLSGRAVTMFMPSMFSGVALGHYDTCLIVFAGYEPHRTTCAIEAINPSKLVMVYGEPERSDLKWRLDLSKIMHNGIDNQLMKTEEVVLASEVDTNLRILLEYYEYLYDDHVLCVCPTNSKMQAVASALAWETYPDIQLNFPIPADFLAKKFSIESRDTFVIDLGLSSAAQRFLC